MNVNEIQFDDASAVVKAQLDEIEKMSGKISSNAKALLTEAIVLDEGLAPPRRVDLKKLRSVVTVKKERSEKGRHLVFYVIFISIYIVTVILQRNPRDSQTMQQAMQTHLVETTFVDPYSFELKGFKDTATVDDMWHWLQAVLVEKVIVDKYLNGDQMNKTDIGTILMHNRLTSGFRLTQRRVQNGSCIERKEFQNFAPNCYGRVYWDARLGPVDKTPFYAEDLSERYEFADAAVGSVDIPFLDSGFFQLFQMREKDKAKVRMAELRRQMWVNEGTSWLRADYVTYNPNVRLFGYYEWIFDLRPSGQIKTEFRSESVPAAMYETFPDLLRMGLEILTVLSWCNLAHTAIKEMVITYKKEKSIGKFFASFDNCVNFVQILLFFSCFCWWAAIIQNPIRGDLVVNEDAISFKDGSLPNFTTLAIFVHDYFVASAVNLVLSLFRILNMMQVNPNISQLSDTFGRCRKNIIQFGIVLVLMIIAFEIMAHLMFGAKMREFSTFDAGFISTVQVMLGAFSYNDIAEVDNIAAPVFYYPFVFIMIFVVFNMTIAIIMDGYAVSQEERKADKRSHLREINELKFYQQLFRGVLRYMGPIKCIIPHYLRYRVMKDGTKVDKFTEPSKAEVFAILEPVDKLDERFITIAEYKDALDQANIPMRETTLEQIVERHHSWEDMEEPVYKRERIEKRKIQDAEKTERTITLLQERVATIVAMQQQMGAKVDAILRSFVITQIQTAQQI